MAKKKKTAVVDADERTKRKQTFRDQVNERRFTHRLDRESQDPKPDSSENRTDKGPDK